MSKPRTRFVCERCGVESPQWHGKCLSCGEWHTLVEVRIPEGAHPAARRASAQADPRPAGEVESGPEARLPTGVEEFDRVLGGGVVPGSVALVAGDPGIGKSTLLLQAANSFAARHGCCLYVSGEESLSQVALRSRRLQALSNELLLFAETEVGAIREQVERVSPQLMVVDSIQAMYSPDLSSLPGTVSQVRDCATQLLRLAKDLGMPTLLVGHVTKDGVLAGPRLLEHMVDTVLSLEGDRYSGYRILRAVKNRFGSTDELGLFQMTDTGMEGVPDASAALLAERRTGIPGSSVVPAMEGTRPLLLEIQALVTRAASNATPRRSVTGLDYGRACLVLAVLEKRVGLPVAGADVFVNIPGGVRAGEPATDLGMALAIAGSLQDTAMASDTACVGEVGLTGEIRSVPHLDRRLAELARCGFKRCLAPSRPSTSGSESERIEVVGVEDISQALQTALGA